MWSVAAPAGGSARPLAPARAPVWVMRLHASARARSAIGHEAPSSCGYPQFYKVNMVNMVNMCNRSHRSHMLHMLHMCDILHVCNVLHMCNIARIAHARNQNAHVQSHAFGSKHGQPTCNYFRTRHNARVRVLRSGTHAPIIDMRGRARRARG